LDKFSQIWSHFGALNRSKSIKNRALSKKHGKTKNLPKPQFLQWFLKVWAYKICSNLKIFYQNMLSKIVLISGSVFSWIFDICGALWISFWELFGALLASWGDFGRLWGNFGHRWASNWGSWVQLGRLGIQFWLQT